MNNEFAKYIMGGNAREVFDPPFDSPIYYRNYLSAFPNVQDAFKSAHLTSEEKFRRLAIHCWTARPVEQGAYLVKVEEGDRISIREAYQQLESRTSSHVHEHADLSDSPIRMLIKGYQGGRTAVGIDGSSRHLKFLSGYDEILVHWITNEAGDFVMVKFEGAQVGDPTHALHFLGFGGDVVNNALHAIAASQETAHWVEEKRKERVDSTWCKLCANFGIIDRAQQTVSYVLQKALYLLARLNSDQDVSFQAFAPRRLTAYELQATLRILLESGQQHQYSGPQPSIFSSDTEGKIVIDRLIAAMRTNQPVELTEDQRLYGRNKISNWIFKARVDLTEHLRELEADLDALIAHADPEARAVDMTEQLLFGAGRIGHEVRLTFRLINSEVDKFVRPVHVPVVVAVDAAVENHDQ